MVSSQRLRIKGIGVKITKRKIVNEEYYVTLFTFLANFEVQFFVFSDWRNGSVVSKRRSEDVKNRNCLTTTFSKKKGGGVFLYYAFTFWKNFPFSPATYLFPHAQVCFPPRFRRSWPFFNSRVTPLARELSRGRH